MDKGDHTRVFAGRPCLGLGCGREALKTGVLCTLCLIEERVREREGKRMNSHSQEVKEVWVNTVKYEGFKKITTYYDKWGLRVSSIPYDLIRHCEKAEKIAIEVLTKSGYSLVGVGYITGIEINPGELDVMEMQIERANVVKEIKINMDKN